MKDLAGLLLVIAQGATAPRGPSPAALAGVVLAVGLAVLCGIVAAGCLLASLWLVMIPLAGPAGAPLAVAGALLAGALAALLAAHLLRRPRPPAPADTGGTVALLVAALVAGIAAGARRP